MLQITESRFETGKVATYVYYVYAYDDANKEYSLHGRIIPFLLKPWGINNNLYST